MEKPKALEVSAFVGLLRPLRGVVGLLVGGDGGERSSIVVGDTEDIVDLAEDAGLRFDGERLCRRY